MPLIENTQTEFQKSVNTISDLIGKAYSLAEQAENYFWSTFTSETDIRGYVGQESHDVCLELCEAAKPVFDNILSEICSICGVEFVPLGEGDDDPVWEVAGELAPTRTLYAPAVKALCEQLKESVRQLAEYDRCSANMDIRVMYGGALDEIATHIRNSINEIGPLWPRVICYGYPATNTPNSILGVAGWNDIVYPTGLEIASESTRCISIRLKFGNMTLNPLNFGLGERFQPDLSVQDGLAKRNGGLIYIKAPDEDGDPSPYNGVYEIMYIIPTGEMYMKPIPDFAGFANGTYIEPIDSDGFLIRAIRRAEDIMGDNLVCVEYEAPLTMVEVEGQKFSYILDGSIANSHYTPVLSSGSWQRYDAGVAGAVYDATISHLIENVTVDTLFVTDVAVPEITDFTNGGVYAIATDTDRVIIGGSFNTVKSTTANNIAAFVNDGVADGTVDVGFVTGAGFNGPVYCICVGADGAYYVGGSFSEYNEVPVSNMVKLASDGTLDETFAFWSNGAVRTIAYDADTTPDTLVIGGDFTVIEVSKTSSYIARINITDGSIEQQFSGINNRVRKIILDGGYIYFCGLFTTCAGYTTYGLAQLTSAGSWPTDPSPPNAPIFSPYSGIGALTHVHDIVINADGLWIVGGLEQSGGNYVVTGKVKRLNKLTGAVVDTGDPESNQNSHVILGLASGAIMGSQFNVSVANDAHVLLLGSGTDIDDSVACDFSGQVYALAHDGTDIFVGGLFDQIGGVARKNLAKLDPATLVVDSGFA